MRCLSAAAAAGLLLASLPAAAIEAEAVRAALENRFPVQVLRIEPAQHDGRAVFVATVMQRAGNYNDALRVSRLMVDAETGGLIPQYAGRAAGSGPDYRPSREGIEALRD